LTTPFGFAQMEGTMASTAVRAIDFLLAAPPPCLPRLVVLFGDNPYLMSESMRLIRQQVLGDATNELSLRVFCGSELLLCDLSDALSTRNLFGGPRRLVVVEQADRFVQTNRSRLEALVEEFPADASLVLEMAHWSSGTRLQKRFAEKGLQVDCRSPEEKQLIPWITRMAEKKYGVKLSSADAKMLLDMVPPDPGRIEQEVAKLALVAGPQGRITAEQICQSAGGWRTRSTWNMVDAAVNGDASHAIEHLDRLIRSGEDPFIILSALASTLRRFAAGTRLFEQAEAALTAKPSMRRAVEQAGFPPFVLDKAASQLNQIGRRRGRALYQWLLEADLASKGPDSSPARLRLVLEELIARLSRAADARLTQSQH
jgi:DNA polymerase-3 subunit delta